MSSLKAARADNFHHPDPSSAVHDSRWGPNRPLTEYSAWKRSEGVTGVRFEIPYHIRCSECNSMLAKGVRFNAQKKIIGKYFSTSIIEFAMRCHYCTNRFVIKTDPEHCGYALVSGCSKYRVEYSANDAQTIELPSREERRRLEGDAMYKAEKQHRDAETAKTEGPRVAQIQKMNEKWNDDFELNQRLRKRFREQKQDKAYMEKLERDKTLLPLSQEDIIAARKVTFKGTGPAIRKIQKLKQESIFASSRHSSNRSQLHIE